MTKLPARITLPARTEPLPDLKHDPSRESRFANPLMHRLAMDIGKQVVEHIEHAYPEMFKAVAHKSAALSIRNSTYNAIMAAGEAFQKGETELAIKRHEEHRRTMRKLRKAAGKRK